MWRYGSWGDLWPFSVILGSNLQFFLNFFNDGFNSAVLNHHFLVMALYLSCGSCWNYSCESFEEFKPFKLWF